LVPHFLLDFLWKQCTLYWQKLYIFWKSTFSRSLSNKCSSKKKNARENQDKPIQIYISGTSQTINSHVNKEAAWQIIKRQRSNDYVYLESRHEQRILEKKNSQSFVVYDWWKLYIVTRIELVECQNIFTNYMLFTV